MASEVNGLVRDQDTTGGIYLCTGEHDLAGHEDQEYDFRLEHAVDEPREEL
jgi:hypothetical protein